MGRPCIVGSVTQQKKVSEHVRFADDTRLVSFRMPKGLEKRLVRLQGDLTKTRHGSRVTLTEAFVMALGRGLDALEEEKG